MDYFSFEDDYLSRRVVHKKVEILGIHYLKTTMYSTLTPFKSMFTSSHYIEGCCTNVSLAALSLFFYCGCSTISTDL
jgi:hypothetical protein